MAKKTLFTKILAVVGTALVWLPILAPVFLSLYRLFAGRKFMFDYLMPGELFPVVLVGGGLLLWAAFRARSQQQLIGGGLGGAAVLLVGSQALAVATGLASGAREMSGIWWILVLAIFGAYILAVVILGVGGGLLVRDVFKDA